MAEEKIITIEKVVQKGKKFLVYTSENKEGTAFTEDQLVNNRIFKGNAFFEKEWKKILQDLDTGVLFDKCLKYIDYQPRTEKDIYLFLKDKDVDSETSKKIIKQLKQYGFIDDDRFAKSYIESKIRSGIGPKVIQYNLLDKGIKQETIDKYLAEYSTDLYYEKAYEIAVKTLKSVVGLPKQKQKETLYSRLLRMGYPSNIINKVLSNVTYSEVDLDELKKTYEKIKSKETDKNKIVQKLLAKGYVYADIKQIMSEVPDFESE